jgi:hypothetical protein
MALKIECPKCNTPKIRNFSKPPKREGRTAAQPSVVLGGS